MTNPTDPRVEAAARAMCRRESGYLYSKDKQLWENVSWGRYKERAIDALKAADEAVWQPIESAPGNTCILAGHPDYVFPAFRDDLFSEVHNLGLFFSNSGGLPCGPLMPQPTHWQPLPTPPENP